MGTHKPRYPITVDEELFEQIEYYRHTHRIASRSQATVQLVRIGMAEVLRREGAGVEDEREILEMYQKIDAFGRKTIALMLERELLRAKRGT